MRESKKGGWGERGGRRTYSRSIIPERHVALSPLEADMDLGTRRHNLVEQRDDVVALCLGHAYNLGDEAGIEEDALPACHGVGADEWVLGGDGLAAHGAA